MAFLLTVLAASIVRAFAASLTFLPAKRSPRKSDQYPQGSLLLFSPGCNCLYHLLHPLLHQGYDRSRHTAEQAPQAVSGLLPVPGLPGATPEDGHATSTLLFQIIVHVRISDYHYVK
jgi:hypothetical protein